MNCRESPARAEGNTGIQRPSARTRASLVLLDDAAVVRSGKIWEPPDVNSQDTHHEEASYDRR